MSVFTTGFKSYAVRQFLRKSSVAVSCLSSDTRRNYADKTKPDVNKTNHVQVQGTENEERMRVRRARPADVPRVLRFVREHSRSGWPGLPAPSSSSTLVLSDYVSRALAQGHSMLAEQQESRRGWSQIRGLALCVAVCPWDADLLEKWSRCIRCSRSKRLMQFTAHCLRAPSLHDKYRVHNILQVIVLVPCNDSPQNTEIVHILAKNVIQRGRETGFPILRFDVIDDDVAKALDKLNLKKECQVGFNLEAEILKQRKVNALTEPFVESDKSDPEIIENENKLEDKYITVYSAFPDQKFYKE